MDFVRGSYAMFGLRKFEGKCKGKKIQRKSRRKIKK